MQAGTVRDFLLLEMLGRGAFGVVYKVKNERGELFAVKKLIETGQNEKHVEGEIKIVGEKLNHDNIVLLEESFQEKALMFYTKYIVMEYCNGGDLGDYMVKHKPDLSTRFDFMTDIARGVCYLHAQGIIHRDIKPENILLKNKEDRLICKITDFGLSRIKESRSHVFVSQVGTLPYLAPEILDGYSYTNCVDVFALGLLFYAITNHVIVENARGEQSFIPAKIFSKTRYEYLNSVIRKENPSENDFVKSYFTESTDMGHFVYFMIQTNPKTRPMMDFVLMKTVEAKYEHKMKLALQDQDLNKEKRVTVEYLEKKVESLQIELSGEKHSKREDEDTITVILDQNSKLQTENQELREQLMKKSEPAAHPVTGVKRIEKFAEELHEYIKTGCTSLARKMMKGLSVDERKAVVSCKVNKKPALFNAVLIGSEEMVDFILDVCHADVNQIGEYHLQERNKSIQVTSLWCAAADNKIDKVKILVKYGADINEGSDTLSSPARSACYYNHIEMVKYLVEAGANINLPNVHGGTCLMNSVHSAELCEFLIEKGANINSQTNNGYTALHFAVIEDQLDIVKLLIKSGADASIKNFYGYDCLQLAARKGCKNILDFLVENIK